MKKFIVLLIVFISGFHSIQSQNELNDYKYIIVPNRYDFFSNDDEFRLNTLTKYFFIKYGFIAMMADEPFPEDMVNNNCKALRVNLLKHNSLFKTKLQVELRDCKNEVVYKTRIGETKVKEFKKAYNLALRDAFKSLENFNYEYKEKDTTAEEELKDVVPVEIAKKELKPKPNKAETSKKEIVELQNLETKKEDVQLVNDITNPVKERELKEIIQVQEDNKKVPETKEVIDQNVLTAKETFNGFKLYDNKSNEVMTIFDSGVQDVYIVKGKDAIIYKKGDSWIYSETNETNLLTQLIKIKF